MSDPASSSTVVDVIVVGTGNAGFCAAHAAAEAGATVLMLEKAPEAQIGGNTYYTAGAIRTTHAGPEDLAALIDGDQGCGPVEIEPYPAAAFAEDMRKTTHGRCDSELVEVLVSQIADTLRWMRGLGMRFCLQYERQSYEIEGRHRFWGNLPLAALGGGKAMVATHRAIAERLGVRIQFESPVDRLLQDESGRVVGVASGNREFLARAVVLASGGFQSSANLRAQFLGKNWDLAKVRGTPHNTGTALMAAVAAGAAAVGHWSGAHAVAWDANAPATGDPELTNRYTKQSYPLSIVVNVEGKRFLDEGADLRNYTYAKYGAEILQQPSARAFQIFDAKTTPLLQRAEYEVPGVTKFEASSIAELARRMGVDEHALVETVETYNAAVRPGAFDPSIKDGVSTDGIVPPKSNWAQSIDAPPFQAYGVTCGITFTFGGVRIDPSGQVRAEDGEPMAGLFAAGETVGGLFYHNYPGGSGLAAGAVFGRQAGLAAARTAVLAAPVSA